MDHNWYRHLYLIGSPTSSWAVFIRVLVAVGAPLIGAMLLGDPGAAVVAGFTALFVTLSDVGSNPVSRIGWMSGGLLTVILGATLGHELGGTPYSREVVVVLCALTAGWASGAHPGIAVVTRILAIAAVVASSTHFSVGNGVILGALMGGASALACAYAIWLVFGIPAADNVMDWRAGLRRALSGEGSSARFAVCYAGTTAVALFAASELHLHDAFWAAMVVLMVMRREGTACIELTILYAVGTILGVTTGALLLQLDWTVLGVATLASVVAAFTRIGFSLNPGLGFWAFTVFVILCAHLRMDAEATSQLLTTRLYDVAVGCLLALAGTLVATYPRFSRASVLLRRRLQQR